ncbi:MAG: DNA repair protein RecN [Pseudomonadota bacterium]
MLTCLAIENIVLIRSLRLQFGAGLNVLTGETGAGKSILLDSLGLALGARADAGLLRAGTDRGSVTAEFDLPRDHAVFQTLDEAGITTDGDLIVRRQLKADGVSRAFCNDAPISAGLLRQLGMQLVEVHGQHDERGLLDAKGHIRLLDQFGGYASTLKNVSRCHAAWHKARMALDEKTAALAALKAEEDYLRASAEELDALSPQPGEERSLADARAQMQRGQRMLTSLHDALGEATGDRGPDTQLRGIIRKLARLPEADDARLGQVLDALDRAAVETDAAIAELTALIAQVEIDPAELDSVETRLFDIRALARKHDVPAEALPALAKDFTERLESLSQAQDDVSALEAARDAAYAAFKDAVAALSNRRAAAADALDQAVNAELPPLKLEAARFKTAVTALEESRWGPAGAETVQFEVATNPNAHFGPIIKIASGGELARFILALKVALAGRGDKRTLIFDEVDRGVGGPTAAAVGKRLARLASDGQVLVVTHSPQVAALGLQHWRISKGQINEHMLTQVIALSPDDRREELARMLSGEAITPEARAAADSLLGANTAV